FFSSRRRHTRFSRDWSSDVCSSDLTFTLSNFGTLFGRYANPIVVPPQVAILGAGGIRQQPVAVEGRVEIHPILPLSLTFDHRVRSEERRVGRECRSRRWSQQCRNRD